MCSSRGFGPDVPAPRFVRQYECYPVSELRGEVERGGSKINMPSSALEQLSRHNVSHPMLFRLMNAGADRVSHCGVLEFAAAEGRVYLPRWMMQNLALQEGGVVSVESVQLPTGTYAKLSPRSTDFLEVADSGAVLENTLRHFTCLTVGDRIAVSHNDREYEVRVLETRPGDAICIFDCDMSVEYLAPAADRDQQTQQGEHPVSGERDALVKKNMVEEKTSPAAGSVPSSSAVCRTSTARPTQRGEPDYSYRVGVVKFFRSRIVEEGSKKHRKCPNEPFPGPGHSLRTN